MCAAERQHSNLRRSRVLLAGIQRRYAVNFEYKSIQDSLNLQDQSNVAPLRAQAIIILAILRRFNAVQTSFHSACALTNPRMLNCLNPSTLFIHALGGSDSHFRFR